MCLQWKKKHTNYHNSFVLLEAGPWMISGSIRALDWTDEGCVWEVLLEGDKKMQLIDLDYVRPVCGKVPVLCGSRCKNWKEGNVNFTRLKILEYVQDVLVWALAMFVVGEMQITDFFLCLCEIFVQRVKRACAVREAEEVKRDESWIFNVWRS